MKFIQKTHMVSLHLLQKSQLKILIFDPQSQVFKIDEEYVNILETSSQTWKEMERNRFLHILYRNDNYIIFTLKTY